MFNFGSNIFSKSFFKTYFPNHLSKIFPNNFEIVFIQSVFLGSMSWHLRDYASDVEAAVTAKLSTWKPQHLSLWSDLVEPPAVPSGVVNAVEVMEIEDQAQAARYREVRAKVAQDIAAMTAYNTANDDTKKKSHVVQVMHQKAQMTVGKQFLGFTFLFIIFPSLVFGYVFQVSCMFVFSKPNYNYENNFKFQVYNLGRLCTSYFNEMIFIH